MFSGSAGGRRRPMPYNWHLSDTCDAIDPFPKQHCANQLQAPVPYLRLHQGGGHGGAWLNDKKWLPVLPFHRCDFALVLVAPDDQVLQREGERGRIDSAGTIHRSSPSARVPCMRQREREGGGGVCLQVTRKSGRSDSGMQLSLPRPVSLRFWWMTNMLNQGCEYHGQWPICHKKLLEGQGERAEIRQGGGGGGGGGRGGSI